jgi:hypothetical protein
MSDDRAAFGGAIPTNGAASMTFYALISGTGQATFSSPSVAEQIETWRP